MGSVDWVLATPSRAAEGNYQRSDWKYGPWPKSQLQPSWCSRELLMGMLDYVRSHPRVSTKQPIHLPYYSIKQCRADGCLAIPPSSWRGKASPPTKIVRWVLPLMIKTLTEIWIFPQYLLRWLSHVDLPNFKRFSKYLAVNKFFFHIAPLFFNFRQPIIDHMQSYQPSITHHRRVHTPIMLDLPPELDGKQSVVDYNQNNNPHPTKPVTSAKNLKVFRWVICLLIS